MNKMKILLGDLSTERMIPNIVVPKDLKTYVGHITKYFFKNAPTSRLPTLQENNLWHYFKFPTTNTFMHDRMFVSLIKVHLLDALSALQIHKYTLCK